eukprot:TRINITY_DN5765_c0_g1_i7.p1 TRINITY_DN5765_c0_g1~~TRINITY_DN5765_c0_g1_i7.p1  ORF type:complete len:150 (+),score=14.76 TRINITY_DN5765_c0_g1_i7:351-800(+)
MIRLSFKTSLAELLFAIVLSPALVTILSANNCLGEPEKCIREIGHFFKLLVTTPLMLHILGYAIGTIAFDCIVGRLIAERQSIATRAIYTTSVPITVIGAIIAFKVWNIVSFPFDVPGSIALILTFLGTCGYNFKEEKPFDMSTEAISY